MGAIVVNLILLALAFSVIVVSARSQRASRRNPRPRPDYVPPFWSAGPWTDWLSQKPWRLFWYLVFFPVAGFIAGIILLVTRHAWGRSLTLASVIGAWRIYPSVRNALRAARTPPGESPRGYA